MTGQTWPRPLLCAAIPAAAAGCSVETTVSSAEEPVPVLSSPAVPERAYGLVETSDKTTDGTSVPVDFYSFGGYPRGWLVVRADDNGKPGPVVGKLPVELAGARDQVVPFDSPQKSDTYWAVLHVDAGQQKALEFPGADVPVPAVMTDVAQRMAPTATPTGAPAAEKFTLTVQ